MKSESYKKIAVNLMRDGVGVMPTDTIYGIVGSALSKKAVARIYKLRKRNLKKPFIVLISSVDDFAIFDVSIDTKIKKILKRFWPGKVSIILPVKNNHFLYLHRGTKTIAFRLSAKKSLRSLLHRTGPLVAPSANIEGEPPATTIEEAKKYFGEKVDFYVDAGRINIIPSVLIAIKNKKVVTLR